MSSFWTAMRFWADVRHVALVGATQWASPMPLATRLELHRQMVRGAYWFMQP